MERAQIDAAGGHDRTVRIFGRLVIIGLLAAASVLSATTNAFATGTLSSIVLPQTEPGLTVASPGTFNGPLTQSNLAEVTGSTAQGEQQLAQLLTGGDLTAYVRLWAHQPADGDAIVIVAFKFERAPDESAFTSGLDSSLQSSSGAAPLTVPGIPGAIGVTTHVTTSGTTLAENTVLFEKGDLLFELQTASASGDLTSADAVSLAQQQFASAPDTPARSGKTNLSGLRVALGAAGLALVIATVVIGRKRKYPTALTGFRPGVGSSMPPAFNPPGPRGVASPQPQDTAGQGFTKVGAGQWQ